MTCRARPRKHRKGYTQYLIWAETLLGAPRRCSTCCSGVLTVLIRLLPLRCDCRSTTDNRQMDSTSIRMNLLESCMAGRGRKKTATGLSVPALTVKSLTLCKLKFLCTDCHYRVSIQLVLLLEQSSDLLRQNLESCPNHTYHVDAPKPKYCYLDRDSNL